MDVTSSDENVDVVVISIDVAMFVKVVVELVDSSNVLDNVVFTLEESVTDVVLE